jgi:hypothetical protein
MAIMRPTVVSGVRSPYPTVLIVVTAHHTPSKMSTSPPSAAAKAVPPPRAVQIDATYGHLVPDSEEYLRGLLDGYDAKAMPG